MNNDIYFVSLDELANLLAFMPAEEQSKFAIYLQQFSIANSAAYSFSHPELMAPFPHHKSDIFAAAAALESAPRADVALRTLSRFRFTTTSTLGPAFMPPFLARGLESMRAPFGASAFPVSEPPSDLDPSLYFFSLPELTNIVADAPSERRRRVAFLLSQFSHANANAILQAAPMTINYSGYPMPDLIDAAAMVEPSRSHADLWLAVIERTRFGEGDDAYDGEDIADIIRHLRKG